MNWIVAITISIITGSFAGILQKVLMKGRDPDSYSYTVLTQLFSGCVCILVVFLLGRNDIPSLQVIIDNKLYIFIAFSGIMYALNGIYTFKALQNVDVSKFVVLYTIKSIVTIVTASIFLNEVLTSLQLIGATFIIFAVVYLNTDSVKKFLVFNKGEFYTIIAAFAFGFATVSDKYLIQWFDFVPYLVLDFMLPALILILARPKAIKEIGLARKTGIIPKLILFSTLYSIAALGFFAALYSADNAALVSGFGQVGAIVTVVMGIVLLKEKDDIKKKLIAGCVSFVGLILLVIK